LLGLVLLLAIFAYRGGWFAGKPHLSAQETASRIDQLLPTVSSVTCSKGTAGWDYICSYYDNDLNRRMKLGAAVISMGGKTAVTVGGSAELADCVPPNPTKHNPANNCVPGSG
jgi:hypothetical protein